MSEEEFDKRLAEARNEQDDLAAIQLYTQLIVDVLEFNQELVRRLTTLVSKVS